MQYPTQEIYYAFHGPGGLSQSSLTYSEGSEPRIRLFSPNSRHLCCLQVLQGENWVQGGPLKLPKGHADTQVKARVVRVEFLSPAGSLLCSPRFGLSHKRSRAISTSSPSRLNHSTSTGSGKLSNRRRLELNPPFYIWSTT